MTRVGRTLVVIPARGGSKRLPRKNVLLLSGKPLISWTIEAAIEACIGTRIIVTSDDDEILGIATEYSNENVLTHERAPELATDTATTVEVLIDVIEAEREKGFLPDTIVLLQPTSPLRIAPDIRNALNLYADCDEKSTVVSVCEVDHPTAWTGEIQDDGQFRRIEQTAKRSQDYPKEYRLNGAVYVASVAEILANRTLFTEKLMPSVMPRARSFDIDDALDFRICECLLQTSVSVAKETSL